MLAGLQNGISHLTSNKNFLLIIILIIGLIGVAVYTYLKYISPRLNPEFVPNKEFVKIDSDVTEATLYFFYVDWCPYCKTAKPILEKLKESPESQKINGVSLQIESVDATNDDSGVAAFEQQHNVKIEGYPTIYLVKGDEVIEYDAKVSESSLDEYLNTVL